MTCGARWQEDDEGEAVEIAPGPRTDASDDLAAQATIGILKPTRPKLPVWEVRPMFESATAHATIAVSDMDRARKFYEETLGLKPDGEKQEGGARYRSGNSRVFVYESQYAGTNQATAATWVVPDAEAVVRDLKAKGVVFEHYDLPGLTRQGDLHVAGSFKGAWLKDPDGNILHVLSM